MRLDPEVAARYGTALYHVARDQGVVDALLVEAKALREIMRKGSKIRTFLEGPHFNTPDQKRVAQSVFRGQLSELLYNLLLMLIDRRRIYDFGEILKVYERLVDEAAGVFSADVFTAVDLDQGQQAELSGCLEGHTGHKLRIRFRIEPRLIGGVVFRYRDLLIDDSVRTRLDEIKRKLMACRVVGLS
ncbi:ATP synthase F1 subunit delta [Candidatus Sumerlaeota bacterium]